MAELRVICEDYEPIKRLFEEALVERLRSLETGITKTEKRLKYLETKYEMKTEEFLSRFKNDELEHRLDLEFDQWIGESRMLHNLQKHINSLKNVEFVN